MSNHKDLDAWKLSIDLVTEIYSITKEFPKDENYCLTNQIRRCAVSIPSNIAEGCARNSDKDLIHFLYISIGSCSELETQIIISKNLSYIQDDNGVLDKIVQVKKTILGLIKYLKTKIK